jgi:nucleotide-binding universal stress UspA family protein
MATIVVGVDGSDESKQALRWALEEAGLRGAAVRAVYAWRDPYVLAPGFGLPEDFEFDALRERAVETLDAVVAEVVGVQSDVPVEAVIVEGSAGSVLVDAARDADMLVVGSRGHGGFVASLLGSVSQQCAQHAACPVLIVREQRSG